jgi:tRNA U34 2-thiouridine synthase MnmA/TrmU
MTALIATITDSTLTLQPTDTLERPASGQSCVLYRGSLCLGGGIIV